MNENPASKEETTNGTGANSTTEEFRVSGEELLAKIKQLIHEGNVRRIVIKSDNGNVIAEFPLTAGVIGALLLPVWAAIGAIAALAADLRIMVERRDDAPTGEPPA